MKTVLLGDMFLCGDREEIELNLVCDGNEDCPEGDDEQNCDGTSGDFSQPYSGDHSGDYSGGYSGSQSWGLFRRYFINWYS